jgi:Bacterial phosphonate metabolism protein (PhnI)
VYVAVKGGEQAIEAAHAQLAEERRGDAAVPELALVQIEQQLGLAVDRVMTEGSLYDRELAALAIKQARGDLVEAIFLLRAYRTTLARFGASRPVATTRMTVRRRVSATFKDVPGGQILGPTFDYTHRLLDFSLAAPARAGAEARPPRAGFGVERPAIHVCAPEGGGRSRPRGADRVGAIRRGLTDRRRHHARAAGLSGRARRQAPEPGPCGRRLRAGPGLRDAARVRTQSPVRGGDPHRRGGAGAGAGGARVRDHHRRAHGDRVRDGEPVHRVRDGAAAVHARLWADIRPHRAQGDGDGARGPGTARAGAGRDAAHAAAG